MTRPPGTVRKTIPARADLLPPPWLTAPNDAFDGLKPLEVIERGESDRIWQMIFLMRSGSPG